MSSTKTRHAYIDGDPTNPGHIYFEQDGARLRCELEPDDVIAALDAMAQEIENLRAELDGRAPVSPADHWSPWLEWRGGPCPLPGDVDVEWERSKSGTIEPACEWTWAQYCRFRYLADNPAGWLPRGEFIPPAELWDEGCPVRCEWHSEDEDGALSIQRGIPGVWHNITHIRLVAREAKAGLPEGWRINEDGLHNEHGAVFGKADYARYGSAVIRQAVDAWLREMGDE